MRMRMRRQTSTLILSSVAVVWYPQLPLGVTVTVTTTRREKFEGGYSSCDEVLQRVESTLVQRSFGRNVDLSSHCAGR
jgi:hypothetical protein